MRPKRHKKQMKKRKIFYSCYDLCNAHHDSIVKKKDMNYFVQIVLCQCDFDSKDIFVLNQEIYFEIYFFTYFLYLF